MIAGLVLVSSLLYRPGIEFTRVLVTAVVTLYLGGVLATGIDEYEFIVHPRLAGHGPSPFAGLSKHVDLRLVDQIRLGSGAVAMRYVPKG